MRTAPTISAISQEQLRNPIDVTRDTYLHNLTDTTPENPAGQQQRTQTVKRKSPGRKTGALTTLTSQDQCAPTILTARHPNVATAGRAKAALRQSATIETT